MGSRDHRFDTPKSLLQFAWWLYPWLPHMERRATAQYIAGDETPVDRAKAERAIGTLDDFLSANKDHFASRVQRGQMEAVEDFAADRLDYSMYSDDAIDREIRRAAGRYLEGEYQKKWSKYFEDLYERRRRRAADVLRRFGEAVKLHLMRGAYRVTAILSQDAPRMVLGGDDLAGATVDFGRNALINGSIRYEAVAISMLETVAARQSLVAPAETGGIRIESQHTASPIDPARSSLAVASEAEVRRELDKIAAALDGRDPPAQTAIIDQVRRSLHGKIFSRDQCRELIRNDERLHRRPGRRPK